MKVRFTVMESLKNSCPDDPPTDCVTKLLELLREGKAWSLEALGCATQIVAYLICQLADWDHQPPDVYAEADDPDFADAARELLTALGEEPPTAGSPFHTLLQMLLHVLLNYLDDLFRPKADAGEENGSLGVFGLISDMEL